MAAVSEIRTLATNQGYEFSYGTSEYKNWDAGRKNLQDKDLIVLDPLIGSGSYIGGVKSDKTYVTTIGLAVKNDGVYQATLDETYEQKYDRRLEDMEAALEAFIKLLACTDGFEILSDRIISDINRFDTNVDIMLAEITFIYDTY
jgi:hypothetical protein